MKAPLGLLAVVWLAAWPPGTGVSAAAMPAPPGAAPASGERSTRETPAALLSLSDEDLARRVELDVASLGSLSIGAPGSAMLLNAVTLAPGPYWEIASTAKVFGTSETIEAIAAALAKVHELFPDAPPVVVGDISDEGGGRLKRHQSHQGGRDVDLGFFYKDGSGQSFVAGTPANYDLPRNWTLVRSLITCTDVETILLDMRIQRMLYKYAQSIGEDAAWLNRVFQFPTGSGSARIVHVAGHRNHYHVRFYNPVAQELGRRVHPVLVELKLIDPPVYTVRHVVTAGQTLGQLAARYGTSTRAIMVANGMSTTFLRAGRAYRIPVRAAAPPSTPIVVPSRLLPPSTPALMASAAWPTTAPLNGSSGGLLVDNAVFIARAIYLF
jgi:LysM repeat protein